MILCLERKYLNLFCYKETCHRRQIAHTSTDLSQDQDSTSFDSDTSRMTFLSSCHLIRFIVEVMILSDLVLSERLSPSAAGAGGPGVRVWTKWCMWLCERVWRRRCRQWLLYAFHCDLEPQATSVATYSCSHNEAECRQKAGSIKIPLAPPPPSHGPPPGLVFVRHKPVKSVFGLVWRMRDYRVGGGGGVQRGFMFALHSLVLKVSEQRTRTCRSALFYHWTEGRGPCGERFRGKFWRVRLRRIRGQCREAEI